MQLWVGCSTEIVHHKYLLRSPSHQEDKVVYRTHYLEWCETSQFTQNLKNRKIWGRWTIQPNVRERKRVIPRVHASNRSSCSKWNQLFLPHYCIRSSPHRYTILCIVKEGIVNCNPCSTTKLLFCCDLNLKDAYLEAKRALPGTSQGIWGRAKLTFYMHIILLTIWHIKH